jgi:hypothetical protein|tara:strand:+ start:267 stop:527 length:261 start_codon:yes stop_codon:yes gene_type:complete
MKELERLRWFDRIKELSIQITDLEQDIEYLTNHYWRDSYTIAEQSQEAHEHEVIQQGRNICAGMAKKKRLIEERENLYNKPELFAK